MISPDTLAAALRVDQYAARRAMLAASAAIADEHGGSETPAPDHAGAAESSAAPDESGAQGGRQGEPG